MTNPWLIHFNVNPASFLIHADISHSLVSCYYVLLSLYLPVIQFLQLTGPILGFFFMGDSFLACDCTNSELAMCKYLPCDSVFYN